MPVVNFVDVYYELHHELAFTAQLKANRLGKYIYSYQELWQYQSVRLAELIEVPEADETGNRQRVFDDTGKLVLETGETPAFPVATSRAPLIVRGSEVGSIEIATTLRGALVESAVVALFCGLLGFAMFVALRVLPMRVLSTRLSGRLLRRPPISRRHSTTCPKASACSMQTESSSSRTGGTPSYSGSLRRK